MATSTSKGGSKTGPDLPAPAGMADGNRILSQLEPSSMSGLPPHPRRPLGQRPGLPLS